MYRVASVLLLPILLQSQVLAAPSFQQLFDNHGLVMLVIDPATGKISQANPAASQFYGYSRRQLEGMSIQEINTLSAEQVAEERERAKTESRNYFIFRHRLANNEIRTVEVHAYPFNFDNKKMLHSIIIDITKQRDLSDALWHHQQQLEETVAAQTDQIRRDSQGKIQILSGGATLLLILVALLWHARSQAVASEKKLDVEHRRLTDVIEGTHVGTWESNLITGEFVFDERWADIVGYTRDELLPASRNTWKFLAHPDDFERSVELLEKHFKGEAERYEMEVRMRHKDGTWVWVLDRAKVSSWTESGMPLLISGTHQDITKRKRADEELRKLSRAIEFSSSAVIISDIHGRIEYVNPKFTEITGYSREEAVGKDPMFLQSGETPESVYEDLWTTVAKGEEWRGELHNRKKDGSAYWARDSVSGVENSVGEITHYISIQDDVTHELELNEQLSYQARHDTLTGLLNRREFERRVSRLLTNIKDDEDCHALCFMDLDQFKVINDTCGHVAGDELLRQLGRLLQATVRQSDTLARLGGDEFGILMEHCTLNQAQRVAESLLEVVRDFHFSWEGQSFRIGISVGMVAVTDSVHDLTELLKQADAACYMAKDLGRNRIHIYHPEDIELARRQGEMQWVSHINQALDENRFCLYAQAIEPLGDNKDRHFEFLLRMLDENGKIVPPGAFLPAAERYDLINKLDAWVVENAFSLIAAHADYFAQVNFVSINLSGKSITNPEFLEFIISQLRRNGIAAQKICFEVTETVAISNLTAASTFISILKDIGCHFALDDFGSGLSSFGYLKSLPVDYLKIDGMFVKDIVDDPIDRAMVKSINDIGHVMGMKTIAEFVENDAVKDQLAEIGVDYAQGYGIGKPQLVESMLELSKVS